MRVSKIRLPRMLRFAKTNFYDRMAQLEPWWSGLTYLFAKEAGLNGPRGFESLRFRQHELARLSRGSRAPEELHLWIITMFKFG